MATTITSSIGTSSRDYSTISAWESDTTYNLVTADVVEVGECYADGTFAEAVDWTGATTDATRYRELTAAVGHWHEGVPGAGVVVDGAYFFAYEAHAVVSRIELRATSSTEVNPVYFETCDCLNLLIGPVVTSSAASSVVLTWMEDCQAANIACRGAAAASATTFAIGLRMSVSNSAHNITVETPAKPTGGGAVAHGIVATGVATLRNVFVGGTGDYTGRADVVIEDSGHSLSSLATSDGTADDFGGTGHLVNIAPGDAFVNFGAGDFSLKITSPLIDAGVDASALLGISTDIAGTTRPEGLAWDIGAWEYVFPAAPTDLTATAVSSSRIDLAWTAGDVTLPTRIYRRRMS